jgi:hypothetical protein
VMGSHRRERAVRVDGRVLGWHRHGRLLVC